MNPEELFFDRQTVRDDQGFVSSLRRIHRQQGRPTLSDKGIDIAPHVRPADTDCEANPAIGIDVI
jgi:hypothetical protein